MKISIVVPVYKESKFLLRIADRAFADHHIEKELIVVVDGAMTQEIQGALASLDKRAKVIFPNVHVGKAEALNRAVAGLDTDILLFLDNDIELPDDPEFLSIVSSAMERFQIVEMPKEVVSESLFSRMIGFEYLSLAIASFVFAKIARRSPGLIGSAFAVKKELFDRLGGFRKVVHEDGDFAARAFRLHAGYSYDLRLKVRTTMPNTLSDWISQRKRWTLINVLWFKENFIDLLLHAVKQPSLLPALLFLILPTLLSFFAFVLFNSLNLSFMNPLLFMLEQPLQFIAGILLWFAHHRMYSQGLAGTAMGFLSTILIYFAFSRLARFRFDPLAFMLFYFIYTPVLVAINLYMFVAYLFNAHIKLDWKV